MFIKYSNKWFTKRTWIFAWIVFLLELLLPGLNINATLERCLKEADPICEIIFSFLMGKFVLFQYI